ncbi:MAG: cyclase family protein, partial [Bacteroidia bacterium]
IIIRTLPNEPEKINHQYSNTNPPFIEKEAISYLNSKGIEHVLIDLPSVDKEKDEGKLEAHKEFWNFNGELEHHKTITEMIYVPNEIIDGFYFLNLMIAPFENDASPSKPVIYCLTEVK